LWVELEDIVEGEMKMKCGIKGCSHHGGRVINPNNPQGRFINLCLHHQVELFTEHLRKYYKESKDPPLDWLCIQGLSTGMSCDD